MSAGATDDNHRAADGVRDRNWDARYGGQKQSQRAAVVLAGTLTAWLAGRAPAGKDAVLALKDDW